jgi:hypothetical protein
VSGFFVAFPTGICHMAGISGEGALTAGWVIFDIRNFFGMFLRGIFYFRNISLL